MHGSTTSEAEVSHVSKHGIWLLLEEGEFFLPFDQFPWFAKGPVAAVLNVQRLSPDHLCWPDLDVDLSLESIREPARYPLMARDAAPAACEVRESGPEDRDTE